VHVTHVVRQYLPGRGGMEEVVRNLCAYQRGAGWEPRVITLNRIFRQPGATLAPSEVIDGVPVTRLPFFGSERYPLTPQVLRFLTACDVLHVHGIDFFFDFLALTKPIHRRPLLATAHGGFFHSRFAARAKRTYFATVTRASCSAYDRIVACSSGDFDRFRDICVNVGLIENGVDLNRIRRRPDHYARTILYFGRFSKNKQLPLLLETVFELTKLSREWRLVVAGRKFDVGFDELETEIRRLGLTGSVRLVDSPSDADLSQLVSEASYFACFSAHEGFGLGAVEAMAAGLIPILSDIDVFRALVDRFGTGICVQPWDAASCARRIEALDFQVQTGEVRPCDPGALKECFGWDVVGKLYLREYESIAGEN
jgi:alpha-1,3-mannosyltransferase